MQQIPTGCNKILYYLILSYLILICNLTDPRRAVRKRFIVWFSVLQLESWETNLTHQSQKQHQKQGQIQKGSLRVGGLKGDPTVGRGAKLLNFKH